MPDTFNVLAVSGSLRQASVNSNFLHALARLKPDNINLHFQTGLGSLPLFNPDNETIPVAEVTDWRSNLQAADWVIIASPEYAHGVTGVIKNALDWSVSSGEFTDKPVSIPNLSPRAGIAHAQLIEIITVMGAHYSEECSPVATLTEPYIIPGLSAAELCEQPEINSRLRRLWEVILLTLTNRHHGFPRRFNH
ncbi:NADPH-dependent FMN reductase [Tatumella sp. JGM118]|uniref:NADPH-dependent FMN reductase n=1 Tax=Tatumella terrea TaxID=419007 RepID=A0ABW1W427_9GAMM|nr:NADPH-dependent FMN reductase [Tatumella sp. JGM118]MBS0908545.1 NAD(P)H-dependent oxidoreductase [Tatumella sp. JGM118]